ncbi:esterase/lipase family protein [Nakamurella deserti]|uniref:esterase/lipase family protein n=1 Tax=Nakamurella deserti TaxID=2164074 RepID=UPI0013004CD2|nr:alpha/beta fold hydrolase [Nakamurella deserti]
MTPTTASSIPTVATPASTTASREPAAVDLGPVGVAGVNDATCTSSAPPVVLLHGTLSTIAVDFPVLVPALRTAGRCVWGVDYGRGGTAPVRDSAALAGAVIRRVVETSGAAAVDVVGFSQGGLVLRTALRLEGVAGLVRTAVLVAPSFHGTTSPLVAAVPAAVCPACADQAAGSALLTDLAAGGDLDGTVRYAVVVTSTDAVVTPWESQLPIGPPDRVRSVVVDQRCPGLVVRHEDMARRPSVVAWVVAALAAAGDVTAEDLPC